MKEPKKDIGPRNHDQICSITKQLFDNNKKKKKHLKATVGIFVMVVKKMENCVIYRTIYKMIDIFFQDYN